jgi:hypothetical protein
MSNDQMAARQACQDVLLAYTYALDEGDNERAIGMMTDDVAVVMNGAEQAGAAGRKAILSRSPEIVSHHILTNVLVNVLDATNAEAHAYVLAYRGHGRQEALPLPLRAPHGIGHWRLRFRKTGDAWRISRMDVQGKLNAE